MTNNRRKGSLAVFLIIMVVVLGVGIWLFLMSREEKRNDIEDLINSEMYLRVEYGIVDRPHKLQEKNALFKRTMQDNKYYLYLTKDNVLFTYYLDWYYNIDPLRGYNLEYKFDLKEKQVTNIMDAIKEKAIPNLAAKNETDYVSIFVDGDTNKEYAYIDRHELQMIFQDNDVLMTIDRKKQD